MVLDATSLVWLSRYRNIRVLRWPADAAERPDPDQPARPCLWLVEPDERPPAIESCLEDWAWLPASDLEVETRLGALSARAERRARRPAVDRFGQLTYRGQSLFLSPTEARIIHEFAERFGEVVEADGLLARVWHEGGNTEALRVHVCRLRRRIEPLGLAIATVRRTGYLMADADAVGDLH